jgi:hypothetical protein
VLKELLDLLVLSALLEPPVLKVALGLQDQLVQQVLKETLALLVLKVTKVSRDQLEPLVK